MITSCRIVTSRPPSVRSIRRSLPTVTARSGNSAASSVGTTVRRAAGGATARRSGRRLRCPGYRSARRWERPMLVGHPGSRDADFALFRGHDKRIVVVVGVDDIGRWQPIDLPPRELLYPDARVEPRQAQ